MRSKPMIDNEEQVEIWNQDDIFIMADRYFKEQQLMFQMTMEYMNERKTEVKFIQDIEFEEITEDDKASSSSTV